MLVYFSNLDYFRNEDDRTPSSIKNDIVAKILFSLAILEQTFGNREGSYEYARDAIEMFSMNYGEESKFVKEMEMCLQFD